MVASTTTDDTGTAPAPTAVAAAPPTVDRPTPAVGDDRRARLLALALALLPFAVSAVALVLAVGGRYVPSSDHAMTEMQIRDVGRHDVLVGLYSRADWNHPGPMIFYLLAPFYWLTGGLAIGMNLGALAINGGSVAGMGLIARRRGGTPLMLLTLLGCTLLLRTLGAEFAHDPWNCFITTLPFGLMIFLAWSMWCGEAWALPVGAVVATFLTQTHIGFVVLALPLLAWGGLGLAVSAWRGGSTAAGGGPAGTHGNGSAAAAGVGHPDGNGDGDPGTAVGTALDTAVGTALDTAVGTALDTAVGTALDTAVGTALDTAVGTALDTAVGTALDTAVGTAPGTAVGTRTDVGAEGRSAPGRTRLQWAGLVTAVALGVLWLPPFVDELVHTPGNLTSIVRWFHAGEDGVHTVSEGWRVISAQFALVPEWLTVKKPFNPLTGESPYMYGAPVPVLGLAVVVALVVLWRRGTRSGRALVATLAVTVVLGVAAVARTVGSAFDYRLRWTFIPGLVGLVALAWVVWLVVAERWPRAERRILVPASLAALTALCVVNGYTAATAGSPQGGDTEAMNELIPEVLDEVGDVDGQVAIDDVFQSGAWHARGLVLALEKAGVDARVDGARADLFGRHRVVAGAFEVRLVVAVDKVVDTVADQPGTRVIAEWSAIPLDRMRELEAERRELETAGNAGRIGIDDVAERSAAIDDELRGDTRNAGAYHVVVYLDETVGGAATGPPATPVPAANPAP